MTDLPAGPAPRAVRAELGGGDPFGAGDDVLLSWWLPAGATTQYAYQLSATGGDAGGWVESDRQSYVPVPLPGPGRDAEVRVRVLTDDGESAWSAPVAVAGGPREWAAAWVGVGTDLEPEPAAQGERPAWWLRAVVPAGHEGPARLHVSALGLYEVFLGGRRVGDHELAPGFTQYARRVPYQSYDVELGPGPVVLAVLLADGWYRGQVGLPRAADQFGDRTALRLQLELLDPDRTRVAATGAGWRAAPSHVVAADLIGGQREDRRLLLPVHDAGFDDSGWAPAVVREVDVAVAREVAPPVRRVEELRPVSVTRVDDADVVDLGQNVNGWVRLRDLGPAGTESVLRHGEHLDAAGRLTTAHLDVNVPILPEPLPVGQVDAVVSAGVPGEKFEPRFTTHGFRYVSVAGRSALPVLSPDDVTGVFVHSDLRRTGWFACSDERLNRLHDAVVASLRGNVCGIPTDCPQRERAGWTGDWQIFAPTAAYLYDVLAFTRSWLRDVALDQRADGCVANMSPSPPAEGFDGPLGRFNGSAGWGDVLVATPWDLYQAYGDESLLRECWEPARAWVDYAARRAAGERHPDRAAERPVPRPHETYLWDAGFHWGEWLEPDAEPSDFPAFAAADKSEVATAYLHRSAATLASLGEVLGVEGEVVARYRELAAGARAAWQAEFVLADGTLAVQSQASHVRALAFGLVPESSRAAVASRLVELVTAAGTHLATGFLSTPMLLPVLADAGHLETAYALLLQDTEPSWLTMVARGATTVWERWDGVDADGVAHESLNHYSKGAVASFLHRYVAGLAPTSPGYRTFRVAPRPGGGLTSASAALETPYGRVEAAWQLTPSGELALSVTVPPGSSAEVSPGDRVVAVGPGRHEFP